MEFQGQSCPSYKFLQCSCHCTKQILFLTLFTLYKLPLEIFCPRGTSITEAFTRTGRYVAVLQFPCFTLFLSTYKCYTCFSTLPLLFASIQLNLQHVHMPSLLLSLSTYRFFKQYHRLFFYILSHHQYDSRLVLCFPLLLKTCMIP